jgi:FAD/FMN-containing dehydrogenase/Fe-S oxidoreductase
VEDDRRRIVEDLTDLFDGDLRVDPVAVTMYSTDASLYEVEPIGVAFPKSTADVELLASWSADQNVPLIPRGSGTGLVGGAIGPGIVIDFSRYMNRVVSVGTDTVRVQPGVNRDELNRQLKQRGRYFAPDPSNSRVGTVGGMLGVDGAGSHAVRVGSTRDHVTSIECVLSGGQRMELGKEASADGYSILTPEPGEPPAAWPARPQTIVAPVKNQSLKLTSLTSATRKADLLERLVVVLREHEASIRQFQPALLRNCCGYMLRGVQQDNVLDLPRLLVGSEGTLGIFTEATLFTLPLEECRSAAMLLFDSLDLAVQAMQQLVLMEPSACDLIDRRLLSLGCEFDARFHQLISPGVEAALVIEFPGQSTRQVDARVDDAVRLLRSKGIQFRVAKRGTSAEDVELIWALPGQVVASLDRLQGDSRPLPFIEDIAVPPAQLAEFLVQAQRVFQKHEVTATLYSHAASGQIHLRPILPTPGPGQGAFLETIARDLYRQVVAIGGTISGEHGDGLARTAFIRSQYGPLYRAFQQVKDIFDPQRMLNPEKIISNDPQLTVRHLRSRTTRSDATLSAGDSELLPVVQLNWTAEQAADQSARCNGCGTCRVQTEPARMCPFVSEDGNEEVTPRAKANVLRQALNSGSTEILSDPLMSPLLDSCFNCKQCRIDCPSGVDIPRLVTEARAQNVALNGLSKTAWLLSRFHTYATMAARFEPIVNSLLGRRVFRRFLKRVMGLAENRRLPRYARSQFLRSIRVRSQDNSAAPGCAQPTVVYFVDYFANHHDTELAEAFCRVLEHNGFRVFVPETQMVSGMGMVSVGDLSAARTAAEANIRLLAEPAREGYPIVCTEPSAALCLSEEYPAMLKSPDVELVANSTVDAGSFLAELHRAGRLKTDFSPLSVSVAYHTPCHVKALVDVPPYLSLLELIPELKLTTIEKGCSGMAGTFGLAEEHFETSVKIGDPLIQHMKSIDVVAGTTDCTSCRMQMEQQASIPTIHPIKLLALSYGIMPRLAERLTRRPSGLMMS